MDQTLLSQHRAATIWRFVFSACLVPALALANPMGESLRFGDVDFVRNGSQLDVIQRSNRAIIDWSAFSIANGETTDFVQPGAGAAALNRVTGTSPSQIDGILRSNGRILLLNPNGIVVGPNGRVDTASFVASTLDVSDADFLAGGDIPLRGVSQASVINLGTISAFDGDVFLVAAAVENHGSIFAPNGTAGLAAGNDVLLRESGEERVWVRGASGEAKDNGVVNTGTVESNIAELKSFGGNIYGMAVKNEGRVAATGVTKQGGQIFLSAGGGSSRIRSTGQLVAKRPAAKSGGKISVRTSGAGSKTEIAGTVDARGAGPGEVGGEVLILGTQIDILPDTVILADGQEGGGQVRIGGGRSGLDPNFNNAEFVKVGEGVEINASANTAGGGGEVILFAEDTLDFYGHASVRGGEVSGDGGFVELSGKRKVNFPGFVKSADTRALNGENGSLLFDPIEVFVQPGAGGPGNEVTSGVVNDRTNLWADDISSYLEFSGNLEIRSDGAGTGNGDITFTPSAVVSWTSANSFTVTASGSIVLAGGSGINSAAGSITLENLVGNSDGILLDAGVQVMSGSGDITLIGRGSALTGGGNAGIRLNAGSQISTSSGGDIWLNGRGLSGAGISMEGSTVDSGTGDIMIATRSDNGTGSTLDFLSADEITIQADGGDVFFSGYGQISADRLTLLNPLDNSVNFDLSSGDLYLNKLSVTSPIGSLDLPNRGNLEVGSVSASGNITIDADGTLTTAGALDGGGDVGLYAGTLNLNHSVTAGGSITTGPSFLGGGPFDELELEIEVFDAFPSGHVLNANVGLFAPSVFINGDNGDDIFNITGGLGSRENGEIAEVNGELGFDTLNINYIDLEATSLNSVESIRGQGQLSTIRGRDTNETYLFSGANVVTIGGRNFEGFESLESGNQGDTFQLAAGLTAAPFVNDFAGIDTLITAAGFNDLVEMDEINEGTVNSIFEFGGIEIIDTNTGDDLFLLDLGTASQQVIGGAGFDRIHTTGLFLIGESALSGIEEIRGIGTSDLLTIDELATGVMAEAGELYTLAADGSIGHKGVSYLDFERLWGGSQDDSFILESGFTRDISIQGLGGIDTLTASSADDLFTVTSESGGNLNSRVRFSTVEKLSGGAGNDQFTFENQATVESVDGGAGTDRLTIDDTPLGGTNTYNVTEGLVSRNPQYRFSNIESLQLLLGPGDDTVNAEDSGADLNLNGGGGFDTLSTNPPTLLDGTPFSIGGSSVTYTGFEAPFAPVVSDPVANNPLTGFFIFDVGDILTLELGENEEGIPVFTIGDESGNGTFLIENNFNENGETEGFTLLGLSDGGAGLFGAAPAAAAAALVNLGQAVVITVDGGQFLLDSPASLDGTFAQPSFEIVAALRESLSPTANGELARALGFTGAAFLINQDGATSIDLTGPPPPALLALLQESLAIGAAQELAGALGLVIALPLTNIDGPTVIGFIVIQPGQETLQALLDHLGAAAEAELQGALGN